MGLVEGKRIKIKPGDDFLFCLFGPIENAKGPGSIRSTKKT